MPFPENLDLKAIITAALQEDHAFNDITTKSLGLGIFFTDAQIVAKEKGVLAGITIAFEVFKEVDPKVNCKALKNDGETFKEKDVLAVLKGRAASILTAERTALNLLTRLSGIATLTNAFVEKAANDKVKIVDTRKTTPGIRVLEKYAVRMGGGFNHRNDLEEAVLIKDNHIAAMRKKEAGITLAAIVERTRSKVKDMLIGIEVNTVKEFKEVIVAKPDIIMLDNMDIFVMRECVRLRNRFDKNIQLEISGNVHILNVAELAKIGAERISIGALTHSPKAIDMSLQII